MCIVSLQFGVFFLLYLLHAHGGFSRSKKNDKKNYRLCFVLISLGNQGRHLYSKTENRHIGFENQSRLICVNCEDYLVDCYGIAGSDSLKMSSKEDQDGGQSPDSTGELDREPGE